MIWRFLIVLNVLFLNVAFAQVRHNDSTSPPESNPKPQVLENKSEEKKSETTTCPERHIGFVNLGAGDVTPYIDENKVMKSVDFRIDTSREEFKNGIPLPCVSMLDVLGNPKDDKDTSKFDLTLRECDKDKKSFWKRVFYDPDIKKHNESDVKIFNFNTDGDGGLLRPEYLKKFFVDGKLSKGEDVDKFNEKLKLANCKLKEDANKEIKISSYIDCSGAKSERKKVTPISDSEITEHLAIELRQECGIAYKDSNDTNGLFLYSSNPNYKNPNEKIVRKSAKDNLDEFKACVKKFSNIDEKEKLDKVEFAINNKNGDRKNPSIKGVNDFTTYNKDCRLVSAKDVYKDMNVIVVNTDVARNYTDDVTLCENCNVVSVINNQIQLVVGDFGGELNKNPCHEINEMLYGFQDSQCSKDFSCNKISACGLNNSQLEQEIGPLGKLEDYSKVREKYGELINLQHILPLHQVSRMAKEQGREISSQAIEQIQDHLSVLKKCSENAKYIKNLSVSNPQASSKYLAESLKGLNQLVTSIGNYTKDASTLKSNASTVNEAIEKYIKGYKALPKTEEEMKKYSLSDESCNSLSNILNDKNICDLKKENLENAATKIKDCRDGYGKDEDKKKFDEYISAANNSLKVAGISAVSKYLEAIGKLGAGVSEKEDRMNAATVIALHPKVKKFMEDNTEFVPSVSCGSESAIKLDDLINALGKEGNHKIDLADFDSSKKPTTDETNEDEKDISDIDKRFESLENKINQNMSQLLAQIGGGGAMQGMNMYASAMLSAFNAQANSFRDWSNLQTNSSLQNYSLFNAQYDKLSQGAFGALMQSNQMWMQYNSSMMNSFMPMYRPASPNMYYSPIIGQNV